MCGVRAKVAQLVVQSLGEEPLVEWQIDDKTDGGGGLRGIVKVTKQTENLII